MVIKDNNSQLFKKSIIEDKIKEKALLKMIRV
jgi:hypothetical protein